MKSSWPTIAIVAAGLLLGFSIGVLYTWIISPVAYIDTSPASLRSDFKDQYRLAIADAYAADSNLPRARVRLALLGDADPALILMDQSRRASGLGGSPASALALVGLAQAISPSSGTSTVSSPTIAPTETATPQPSISPSLVTGTPGTPSPTAKSKPSRTPGDTITPRPTATPSPTTGAPFAIATNNTVCDESLQPGLLQVIVKDADGKQVPGVEIIIAWQGGQESFFTGLKPELGDGYADYAMQNGVIYSIKLAMDSETASDLSIPSCKKKDGSSYAGGLLVIFQQP